MTKILYFAYGMNTNLDSMASRCPKAKSLGYAILPDYRFRFAHHADVVPDTYNKVDGVLWELTEDCLRSLDMLEGYPFYYDRKLVTVEASNKAVNYQAWVYYMQPGHIDSPPSDHYVEMLLEGYTEHNVSTRQIVYNLPQKVL
jgi:gamma-glutamylcyclotransferase (GGCT)/AIG2-like uncharacterized protein YtfP